MARVRVKKKATPAWARRIRRRLQRALPTLDLPTAVGRYRALVAEVLESSLQRELADPPACAAGCATCCHQPILVDLLEVADLYFADEARLSTPEFRARVDEQVAQLDAWRAAGDGSPADVARRQFAAWTPCVMLNEDARCSVHPHRPTTCRNAFAVEVCTPTSMKLVAFPVLARTAAEMRADLYLHFGLERWFPLRQLYLPELLQWLLDGNADALRPLWAGALSAQGQIDD